MPQFGSGWSNPPGYPAHTGQHPAAPPTGQQPPAPGGGTIGVTSGGNPLAYYVICNPIAGAAIWYSADNLPFPPSYQSQPFTSAAAAQAYLSANPQLCSGAPPPQPQPPSGPGPSPASPCGPAPSDNPDVVCAFWVLCYFRTDSNVPDMQIGRGYSAQQAIDSLASSLGDTLDQGETVTYYGPYQTFDEASAGMDANKFDCQKLKKRIGKAKSCVVKSLIDCPTVPPGLSGLGSPGTPEWCAAVDQVIAALGGIGDTLFKWIDERLDSNLVISNIDDYYATLSSVSPIAPFVALMKQVVCWMGPFVETLRTSISCVKTWVATLFPKCNTTSLFGLLTIRHILLSLERIEWGSDAAVWVTAVSGFMIDPMMTTLDYLIRYSCPIELVDEASVIEAWKYGLISEDLTKCLLAAHGKQYESMMPFLFARGDKMNWREAIQYVRRKGGGPEHEDGYLRALGVVDPVYREALRTVYNELPTISDHLEWLRKNVFDDKYVKDFRLLDGFEDRFWNKFGGNLTALGMEKRYAELHYAAHWINPGFSQQFQMVQRLRPGRVDPSLEFTRADLLRTMQEMDVGAFFRERLEAVSHPIPNLTLCLQMYEFGTVNDAEFVEKLKDLGFTDESAGEILAAQVVKVRRRNAASGHGWTPASLAQYYALGALTAQQVDNEMSYLGYSPDASERLKRRAEIELRYAPVKRIQQQIFRSALATQQRAYKCGSISAEQLGAAYKSAGIPDSIAQIGISDVDNGVAVDLCGQQIALFRRAVISGKITLDQARDLLTLANVPQLRVSQYVASWALQVKTRSAQAGASQILRWVASGLLPADTARQRLLNLGWSDPDLVLLLAESQSKLAVAQQRSLSQAAKSQASAARAALRSAQEAQAVARRLTSGLRGIASVRTLQKWLKEGLIDDAEFIASATTRGYPLSAAETYLAEAKLPPKQRSAKTKAAAAPQATNQPG